MSEIDYNKLHQAMYEDVNRIEVAMPAISIEAVRNMIKKSFKKGYERGYDEGGVQTLNEREQR